MSPRSQANKLSRRTLHRIDVYASEEFSGPLPHPVILERYERTLPGAADRILAMAERQSEHRRHIEERVLKANIRNEISGILVTFLISMTAIGGSIYLIATEKQVAGFLTMLSTLLTLMYNFYARTKWQKENQQKMKEAE